MDNKTYMYVSQWNLKVGAPGLTLFTFDTETGEMELVRQLDDKLSLGCSMVNVEKQVLYVCNECDLFPEMPMNTGRLYSFQIHPDSGELTLMNYKETYCPFTSFVNMDPEGKYLMVSNHSWPNFITSVERDKDGVIRPVVRHSDSLVNLFAINPDGSIGDMVDYNQHPTDGKLHLSLLGRPHIPHPHCIMRSPSGKLYACCDKGDGHIYIYIIEGGRLKLLSRTLTDTPHSEPRYCMFHPTQPWLFVNHEHTPGDRLTVTAFRYDQDGTLTEIGKCYPDAGDHQPKEQPRQMQGMTISPDGRFVYVQAHGYNLLMILAVDAETGMLTHVASEPIQGVWPRALAMSPDGKFLINCCLGGEITVYRAEPDGKLTDTGHHAFARGAGYVSFFRA